MDNLFDKNMKIEIVDEFIANLKKEAFKTKDADLRDELFDVVNIIGGFDNKVAAFDAICSIITMIGVLQNEQKTI